MDFFCIYLLFVRFLLMADRGQNVKAMPSTSRPRGFTGASSSSGGRSAPNTPMSERQQMALLMQMTSSSNQAGNFYLFFLINTSQI